MITKPQQTRSIERQLKRLQRNSTILSIITSILICSLALALLFCFRLPQIGKTTQDLAAYSTPAIEEPKSLEPKPKRSLQASSSLRTPSPSSPAAKAISSILPSDIVIPIPEELVFDSQEFGTISGIDDEWSDGFVAETGDSVSFFGQTTNAKRVIYIMDISGSMRGTRIEIMRDELINSIKKLTTHTYYQIIFFNNHFNLIHSDKKDSEWILGTKSNINNSINAINKVNAISTNIWLPPLEYALNMKTSPDLIIFMTDGNLDIPNDDSGNATIQRLSNLSKKQGVTINTVLLMSGDSSKHLELLAKETNGSFKLVTP